jgi:hypothetical protein
VGVDTKANGGDTVSRSAAVRIELVLDDTEVVAALLAVPEGRMRNRYAAQALRVGVLAFGQASGQLDADAVHREVERLLSNVSEALRSHASSVNQAVGGELTRFLDPSQGLLGERLRRLLADDGEIHGAVQRAFETEVASLTSALDPWLGQGGALMTSLDPVAADGVVQSVRRVVDESVGTHRAAMLRELSLDNPGGALRRMIAEVETRHGKLETALATRVEALIGEFSLDDDSSALSRMLSRMERANQAIASELTLDNESSALSRMQHSLTRVEQAVQGQLTLDDPESSLSRMLAQLNRAVSEQHRPLEEGQQRILTALGEMRAARQEVERSPAHGRVFEDVCVAEICKIARRCGDLGEPTGKVPGRRGRSKRGDAVVVLGSDAAAAGARIVLEAKEQVGYSVGQAREELEEARDNRDATIGIFVFSQKTAPKMPTRIERVGDDFFVVWDADDPDTDLVLEVAFGCAKALCTRRARAAGEHAAHVEALDRALTELEKHVPHIEQLIKWSHAVRTTGERMHDCAEDLRRGVRTQLESLLQAAAGLRADGGTNRG